MRPFKNIMIYAFTDGFNMSAVEVEKLLQAFPLREIGQDEIEVYGFVPAFSQGENFVEEMNNALFFKLGMYAKKLSRNAVVTEVERRARVHGLDILNRTTFKELEEDVTNDLILKAFPVQDFIKGYIDVEKGWLVIEATSERKASLMTALLRKAFGTLSIVGYSPLVEIPLIMTDWVRNDTLDEKFQFLDTVEMKELQKEEGGKSSVKGVPVNSKEIIDYIENSWYVTKIGLMYEDLVSFTLGDDFILKGVRYLDMFQERLEPSDDANTVAQSNAYLMADTVRTLIDDLYKMCYGVSDE